MDSSTRSLEDKPYVDTATLLDVFNVADNLRPADLAEIKHLHGNDTDVRFLLAKSWKMSSQRYVIKHKGKSVGIFGVAPMHGAWGAPWLVGTPGLERIAKEFIKQCPRYVEDMLGEYPNLINFVHKDNTKAIRWLKYLGFTFMPETETGVKPFIKIKRYT